MKTALLAAAAAAAAITISSGAAFAETVNKSTWRPHGTQAGKIYRGSPRVVVHRHEYRPVYRPVYRPGPVQLSAAELAAKRRAAFREDQAECRPAPPRGTDSLLPLTCNPQASDEA